MPKVNICLSRENYDLLIAIPEVYSVLTKAGINFVVDDYTARLEDADVEPEFVGYIRQVFGKPFGRPRRKKVVELPQSVIARLKNKVLPNGVPLLTWLKVKAGIGPAAPPPPPPQPPTGYTVSDDFNDGILSPMFYWSGVEELTESNGTLNLIGTYDYVFSAYVYSKYFDLSTGFRQEVDVVSVEGTGTTVGLGILAGVFYEDQPPQLIDIFFALSGQPPELPTGQYLIRGIEPSTILGSRSSSTLTGRIRLQYNPSYGKIEMYFKETGSNDYVKVGETDTVSYPSGTSAIPMIWFIAPNREPTFINLRVDNYYMTTPYA